MLDQARQILQSHFGYSSFRKGQEQAIQSVIEGKNTICVMPTGGGKSICYQIPALVLQGTTIVISPLISLMKDQVDALKQVGVPAAFINSSITLTEANQRMQDSIQGKYKLLYIAPERLESYEFIESLKRMEIPLVAVDEAHCISQWGHDFRPSYRHIQKLVDSLPNRPTVLALQLRLLQRYARTFASRLLLKKKTPSLQALNVKIFLFQLLKVKIGFSF